MKYDVGDRVRMCSVWARKNHYPENMVGEINESDPADGDYRVIWDDHSDMVGWYREELLLPLSTMAQEGDADYVAPPVRRGDGETPSERRQRMNAGYELFHNTRGPYRGGRNF